MKAAISSLCTACTAFAVLVTVTANKKITPYMDPTVTEACDYSCPEFSKSVVGIYCPRDISDCECDNGTVRTGDVCTCIGEFSCPPNSTPRNDCPASIRQCVCQPGFELVGDECVCVDRDCMTDLPPCDFRCPWKSRSSGLECPASFDDCDCAFGYAVDGEGDGCVCDSFCPPNSVQKEGNPCPRNPCRHCDCVEGFSMVGQECLPQCDYLCPAGSRPKEGLECAEDFGDCECAPGLKEVDGNSCECDLECPHRSSINDGVACPINPNNDCTCKLGFVMSVDGECVETDPNTPCFDCPENALLIIEKYPTPQMRCFGTFKGDCFCDRGFNTVGETCVLPEIRV